MKSFKQYISEVFTNPYEYKIVRTNPSSFYAIFVTENYKLYGVGMQATSQDGEAVEAHFCYYVDFQDYLKTIKNDINSLDTLQLASDWVDPSYRCTTKQISTDNLEQSLRIFSTTISIIKDYIVSNPSVDTIIFSADKKEQSRVKMYDVMANKLAKDYNLNIERRSYGDEIFYTLNRKQEYVDESLQDWLRNIVLAAGLFSANDLEAEKLSPIPVERTTKTKKIISNPRSTLMTVKADTPEERLALLEKMAISSGLKGAELNHFLSQAQHETLGYSKLEEIGSVSKFEKKYGFDTRKGKILGNVSPGDGAKFRGRGFLQLTGKYNYDKIGKILNLDLVSNPSMVSRYPGIAAATAIAYWKWRVSPRVKSFTSKDAVERVTKQIAGSGKEKHLDRRKRLIRKVR
jgi:predicted chitinase